MLGQKILRVITFGLYKGMKKKEDNDNYFAKLVKDNVTQDSDISPEIASIVMEIGL